MEETASQRACLGLAAACSRWPADDRRDAAVRAAARDVSDWPLFIRTVRRHRIEALAQAALAEAGIALPDDQAAILRRRTQSLTERNLAVAAETARLQGVLDAVAVGSLALKGSALAQMAYGGIGLKFSQDIDLAIAARHLDVAIEAFMRDGYRLVRPAPDLDARERALVTNYGREVVLRHPLRLAEVELRWQLINSPSLLAGFGAHSAHQEVAIGGGLTLRTLCDENLFAYLCVHGGGHGWWRLQWLADLNAFVAAHDDPALQRFYRHALAVGAGPSARLALALCERLLGRGLPADIARDIRASPRCRLATAIAVDLIGGPDLTAQDRRFGTTRIAVMQFLLSANPQHYASEIRDLCFRLDDMLAWPLPRALHWLYPAMRLPVWLWRKLAGETKPDSA